MSPTLNRFAPRLTPRQPSKAAIPEQNFRCSPGNRTAGWTAITVSAVQIPSLGPPALPLYLQPAGRGVRPRSDPPNPPWRPRIKGEHSSTMTPGMPDSFRNGMKRRPGSSECRVRMRRRLHKGDHSSAVANQYSALTRTTQSIGSPCTYRLRFSRMTSHGQCFEARLKPATCGVMSTLGIRQSR